MTIFDSVFVCKTCFAKRGTAGSRPAVILKFTHHMIQFEQNSPLFGVFYQAAGGHPPPFVRPHVLPFEAVGLPGLSSCCVAAVFRSVFGCFAVRFAAAVTMFSLLVGGHVHRKTGSRPSLAASWRSGVCVGVKLLVV